LFQGKTFVNIISKLSLALIYCTLSDVGRRKC
jgi:hypothetical protein